MPFFITQGLGAFNDNIFKNALAALLSTPAMATMMTATIAGVLTSFA